MPSDPIPNPLGTLIAFSLGRDEALAREIEAHAERAECAERHFAQSTEIGDLDLARAEQQLARAEREMVEALEAQQARRSACRVLHAGLVAVDALRIREDHILGLEVNYGTLHVRVAGEVLSRLGSAAPSTTSGATLEVERDGVRFWCFARDLKLELPPEPALVEDGHRV